MVMYSDQAAASVPFLKAYAPQGNLEMFPAVAPSSDSMIDVIDSGTEELYFRVAEARAKDMARAVAAARTAFHEGPWPGLSRPRRAA